MAYLPRSIGVLAMLKHGRDARGTSARAMAILAMLKLGRDARGTQLKPKLGPTTVSGKAYPIFQQRRAAKVND